MFTFSSDVDVMSTYFFFLKDMFYTIERVFHAIFSMSILSGCLVDFKFLKIDTTLLLA